MGLRISDLPPEVCNRMEGPKPPDDFESDGVSVVIDELLGIDTRPAGHWHDWAYAVGGTKADRKLADQRLYRNFRHCDLGKFLSQIRYLAVRLFGWRYFRWRT